MSKKRVAVYAGTFDPFTNGHLDIVERGLHLFDEIIILVAVSPVKKPLFNKTERTSMLKEMFKQNKRIRIDYWEGLIVDYCKNSNVSFVIRGLRPTGDFDVEFQMASMNSKLHKEIDMVFFMTSDNHYYISSSMVKEVFFHGGNVSSFVPELVLQELNKLKEK
jgi:pantetheine-phosphate adenylyltransferase